METAAVMQQLNSNAVDYSYRAPLALFGEFDENSGKRRTRRVGAFTTIKVLADIFSFSVFSDGRRSVCTRTIELFKRDLGMSESSVRRALKSEAAQKWVKSNSKNAYEFKAEGLMNGAHYKYEAWMTRPIVIKGNMLVLTHAEQAVLAYFNSEARRQPLEVSSQDIVNQLDMSLPIVQGAINKVCAKEFDLVHRLYIGKNGKSKSKYIINRALFRELGRAEKKKLKALQKHESGTDDASKPDDKRDIKSAVESELYARKRYREESAERVYARALEDKEFKLTDEELKKLAPKLAFAEVRGSVGYVELLEHQRELNARRMSALKRLNISEAELSEGFYIQCNKCSDKLFLSSGKMCGCFSPGAPPGEV